MIHLILRHSKTKTNRQLLSGGIACTYRSSKADGWEGGVGEGVLSVCSRLQPLDGCHRRCALGAPLLFPPLTVFNLIPSAYFSCICCGSSPQRTNALETAGGACSQGDEHSGGARRETLAKRNTTPPLAEPNRLTHTHTANDTVPKNTSGLRPD